MSNRLVVWLLLIILVLLIQQNLRILSIQHSLTGDSNYAAAPAASFLQGFSSSRHPYEGMAACIVARSDNLLLPVWIAYHYTVLPLQARLGRCGRSRKSQGVVSRITVGMISMIRE
jgi:hypothetical protein